MFGALTQQQNRAMLLSRNNNAVHQLSRTRPRCASCPSMIVNQYSVLQSLRNNSRPLLHKRPNQIMIRRTNATTLSQYNSQTAAATRTSHPILRLLHQSLQHTLLKPRSLPLPRYISPQHFTFTLSELCGHSSFILGEFACFFLCIFSNMYVSCYISVFISNKLLIIYDVLFHTTLMAYCSCCKLLFTRFSRAAYNGCTW